MATGTAKKVIAAKSTNMAKTTARKEAAGKIAAERKSFYSDVAELKRTVKGTPEHEKSPDKGCIPLLLKLAMFSQHRASNESQFPLAGRHKLRLAGC